MPGKRPKKNKKKTKKKKKKRMKTNPTNGKLEMGKTQTCLKITVIRNIIFINIWKICKYMRGVWIPYNKDLNFSGILFTPYILSEKFKNQKSERKQIKEDKKFPSMIQRIFSSRKHTKISHRNCQSTR